MRERYGSILSSTVVTGMLVLPLVFFGNVAGQEILHPMAVVILGGLVTTALLNLYVVPSIYAAFGSGAVPEWSVADEEDEEVSPQVGYAKS